MPNPLINIGAAINDGTGELGPRGWLQKINRLPNPDNTVNPLSGDYSGTYEQKITAAVADGVATGKKYCWITQPYTPSLVTFNPAMRMTREGGDPTVADMLAYGASADGTTDDAAALMAANAFILANGGDVWFPARGTQNAVSGTTYNVTGSYLLKAPGRWLGQPGAGVTIRFASNPAPAITLQNSPPTGGSPNTQKYGWGLRGLRLQPGVASNGTCIQSGGSTTDLEIGSHLEDVDIYAWNIGIQFGGVITTYVNCRVLDCVRAVQGHDQPAASGERILFIACAFSQGIGQYAGNLDFTQNFTDVHFIGCSFDSAQLAMNTDITSLTTLTNCHLENVGQEDVAQVVLAGTGTLHLEHCLYSQNKSSPTMPGFISQTGGRLVIGGGVMNHAGTGILAAFVNQTGGTCEFAAFPTRRNTTALIATNIGGNGAGDIISAYHVDLSSPAVLASGTTNDYAIVEQAGTYRLTPNAAGSTLSGLAMVGGNQPGRRLKLVNIGATAVITLTHQDAGSTAANRFLCPSTGSLVLRPGESVQVEYDAAQARWSVLTADQLNAVTGFSSPAALGLGNNNDLSVAQYAQTSRLAANAGGSTITGVAMVGGNIGGRRWRIVDIANALTIANNDVNSAAANRILTNTGANIVLAVNGIVDLEYDGTTTMWRAR